MTVNALDTKAVMCRSCAIYSFMDQQVDMRSLDVAYSHKTWQFDDVMLHACAWSSAVQINSYTYMYVNLSVEIYISMDNKAYVKWKILTYQTVSVYHTSHKLQILGHCWIRWACWYRLVSTMRQVRTTGEGKKARRYLLCTLSGDWPSLTFGGIDSHNVWTLLFDIPYQPQPCGHALMR